MPLSPRKRVEIPLRVGIGPEGLIMGITEDVPDDRWQGSFLAIMRGLQKHARMKPELYREQNS